MSDFALEGRATVDYTRSRRHRRVALERPRDRKRSWRPRSRWT